MTGMEIHDLTIHRETGTRGTLGGRRISHTAAARGTLPTSVKGRAIAASAKEKIDHGIRAEQFGWKFLTPANPQIDLRDQVSFEYSTGDSRSVKVTVPSRARLDGTGRVHHYVTFGVEDNSEQ